MLSPAGQAQATGTAAAPRRPAREDALNPIRGAILSAAFGVPLWMLVLYLARRLF